jgi:ferrochelatase
LGLWRENHIERPAANPGDRVIGVLLLNFGEPEHATLEEVVPFLERIFLTNASLEGSLTPEQARARSRELAERRAPGLIAEYEEIGGSPLNAQATAQADGLARELTRRGLAARVYVGMQFTEPSIAQAVATARAEGARVLVGLPVYPLAGPSTSVAALADMARAVRELGWEVPVREITGWHRHPAYPVMRADGILNLLADNGLDLNDHRTKLVFSAHGTPLKYLREGSRYDIYVQEHCRAVAAAVAAPDYVIGYQNHGNRPIEWTQPDTDSVIESLDADRAIVVPVSFMHEQSETLAELDHDLRDRAEARGLQYYRVPVPFDDARFHRLLADLVEAVVDETSPAAGSLRFQPCVCRAVPGTVCVAQGSSDSATSRALASRPSIPARDS